MSNFTMYMNFRKEIDSMCVPTILNYCQVEKIIDNGEEIGILVVQDGYIDCLYVKHEYRHKHYGTKAVLKYIKKHGMPKSLSIIHNNVAAKAFWNKIFELEVINTNVIGSLYEITALKEREHHE